MNKDEMRRRIVIIKQKVSRCLYPTDDMATNELEQRILKSVVCDCDNLIKELDGEEPKKEVICICEKICPYKPRTTEYEKR